MWSEPLLALLLGCATTAAEGEAEETATEATAPSITALAWSCDPAEASWLFTVETDAWTGAGALWMAEDAGRWERHRVPSVSAEADGSRDRLELQLSTVADWRYQVSGSSTAWRCAEAEALSFQLAVYTRDGDERADCRVWGADPTLWDRLDEVPDCAELWEEPADSADTAVD